jgi:small subunit ribosomal protein S20
MNKKQKNRKIQKQTKRNRMINRRYSSTVKTLLKLFLKKIKEISLETNSKESESFSENLFNIRNNLYKIIDKAVKKGVLHKNNAAHKKAKVHKTYKKLNQILKV